MNERIKEILKNSTGYGLILLISVGYIATAFITVEKSGKSIGRIIADGIVIFLIGIMINRAYELQGMTEGDRDDRVQQALDRHVEAVDEVAPYIDRLDAWCDRKNRDAMRTQRVRILAERGMRYTDYFDEDGMALEFSINEAHLKNRHMRKLELKRIRCYYKALSLRLTPLTSVALISEGGRFWDPYYLGRSKPEYTKESGRSDVITKIVLSVLFGYFGIALIADWSMATLIWKTLQVAVFVVMGSLKKTRSYQFVTEEYRGRITKKTNILRMFMNETGVSLAHQKETVKEKNDGKGRSESI